MIILLMICGSQFPRWVQQSPPFDMSLCVTNKIYQRDGMWLPRWGHKKHCVASVLLFLESLALGGCQLPRQEQATLWRGLWGGDRGPPRSTRRQWSLLTGSLEDPSASSLQMTAALAKNILMTTSWDPELEPPTTQKFWNNQCFKPLGFRATCYIAIGHQYRTVLLSDSNTKTLASIWTLTA